MLDWQLCTDVVQKCGPFREGCLWLLEVSFCETPCLFEYNPEDYRIVVSIEYALLVIVILYHVDNEFLEFPQEGACGGEQFVEEIAKCSDGLEEP